MATKQAIDSALVNEFVGVSHGNINRVRELLAQESALINAAWDWGGGDWETGLGAAAHMGNREIAVYLLSHGARMDIFAAAMLGEVAIVRAMLAAYPDMKHALGPHGIPLMAHAQAGGEQAAEVLRLLSGDGAA